MLDEFHVPGLAVKRAALQRLRLSRYKASEGQYEVQLCTLTNACLSGEEWVKK